jgi:hypothetical protein
MPNIKRLQEEPALSGNASSLTSYPAWDNASEAQRRAWARSILATLRETYLNLPLAERIATKRTLRETALAHSLMEGLEEL